MRISFYFLLFCLLFLSVQPNLGCGRVNLHVAPWSNEVTRMRRNTGGTPTRIRQRLLGGRRISPNVMPWLVIVNLPFNRVCTGSLIASRYVLTAKHCVQEIESDRIEDVTVGYGNVAKRLANEVYVVEIFDHPIADISILELESDIPQTPVCLPKSYNTDNPEKNMIIAGFGRYLKGDFNPAGTRNRSLIRKKYGHLPDSALWTNVQKLDKDKCTLNKLKAIQPTEFCAGGFGSGAMDGDSGGPVMKVVEDRVVQIGVTSRGFQRAINKKVYDAGIYVNLGAYAKWIAETTNNAVHFYVGSL